MPDLTTWRETFAAWLAQQGPGDPAHDLSHTRRVASLADHLGATEGADPAVLVPAAWLHDCVHVPKDSPQRAAASRLSADHAVGRLRAAGYPQDKLDAVHHAIVAHSFTAGVTPETTEAEVLQDADRLDALGAVGLARCLMLGGTFGSQLYHPDDPFCRHRDPDDRRYAVDHLYRKLLKLEHTMNTAAGRQEAARRTRFLEAFLAQLDSEISP